MVSKRDEALMSLFSKRDLLGKHKIGIRLHARAPNPAFELVHLSQTDERVPVKVHVGEWDPDTVSAAIRYELGRSGQVYYVSNRV